MAERTSSRAIHARARLGGAVRRDPVGDHTPERRELDIAKLEDHAQAVADAWPDLREENLSRVAVLFRQTGPDDGPAAA